MKEIKKLIEVPSLHNYLGFIFNSFTIHGCYPPTSQVCRYHKEAIELAARKRNKLNKGRKYKPTFEPYIKKSQSAIIRIAGALMYCGVMNCGKMKPDYSIDLRIIKE